MKNYIILIFALLQFNFINSQTIQQIDSISLKMCKSISELKEIKDDVKVQMVFQNHLPNFYERLNITSQTVADSVKNKVYFRLQKNCKDFRDILDKLEENKSDWVTLSQKPKTEVSKKDFATFLKGGNFYYKEYDGGIVNVSIDKNSWVETFEDRTFSRLTLHRKNDCEFDLEFIESNNEIRRNLSVKGDLYSYGLYKLQDDIFNVWVSQSDNAIYGFRIYPK